MSTTEEDLSAFGSQAPEDLSAFASQEALEEPLVETEVDPLDAFRSRTPEEAIDLQAFGSKESYINDNLDDDRNPTIGELWGLGEYLFRPTIGRELITKRFDTGASWQEALGIDLSPARTAAVEAGQSVQEWLQPKPDELGVSRYTSKYLGQAFDVAGQMVSSPLELFGEFADPSGITYDMARVIRDATRSPEEVLQQEGLADQFSRGLMQTASFFLAGGWARKIADAGKAGMLGIVAWLGASVGGQMGREDAIRHGATEEQMYMAYWANAVFGTSEAAPIGIMLNRIDDLTGGFLTKQVKKKVAKIAAGGLESAIEEALQETFQTFGENWTAKDLAQYDPHRSYSDNLMEAAGVGGSIGMLLGFVTTAAGIRNRKQTDAEIEEKILAPLGITRYNTVQEGLDQIASPYYTILEDHLAELEGSPELAAYETALEERSVASPALEHEKVQAQEELNDRVLAIAAHRAQTRPEGGLHILATVPYVGLPSLNIEGPQTHDLATLAHGVMRQEHDFVQGALNATPTRELHGEGKSVAQIVQEGAHVVVSFSREFAVSQDRLNSTEGHIKHLEDKAKSEELTSMEKASLEELQLARKGILAGRAATIAAARDIHTLITLLRPIAGKASTFLVDDTTLDTQHPGQPGGPEGMYAAMEIGPDPILAHVISMATEKLAVAASLHETNPSELTQAILNREKATVMAIALHEFGHAVATARIQGLHKKVQDGTATDEEKKLFTAVKNDYFRFLRDNLNLPAMESLAAVSSVVRFVGEMKGHPLMAGAHSIQDFIDRAGVTMSEAGRTSLLGTEERLEDVTTAESIDYVFSFKEYMAEQVSMVGLEQASLVNPEALPFFKEAYEDVQKVLETANERFKSSAITLETYIRSHGTRQTIKSLTQIVGKRLEQNPLQAIVNEGLLTKEQADRLLGEGDVFNWFMDKGFNILQIAEQNPHIRGLGDDGYTKHLREWKNEVNNNLAMAEHTLTRWKNLGKVENEKLARLLYDETIGRLPDGGWLETPRRFTSEEIATYGLSEEALLLREDIQGDFAHSLREMEAVLIAAKQRIFASDIIQQTREVNRVKKEFADMQKRPYFPLMRFGDYILQVRSRGDQNVEGRDYENEQLVEYQTFDTKTERDKALTLARKHYSSSKVTVSASHRVTPSFGLQGMPMTLLEHLENKLVSSQHTKEVQDSIKEVMSELKNDALPFRSFRKQFQRRKRVEGYSMDAQRSYANYMTSFSNHIARVKFDHLFKEDFDNVQNSINAINRRDSGDSTRRAKILNHMTDHLNYVMNPVNEFVMIRSAAFFWFLGFNVKSAFVNLTQVPLVTYPYLAARFGDGKAVAEINRAYPTAIRSLTTKNKPKKFGSKEDVGIYGMINRGLSESWLDESLATELALAASEKNLDKTLPRKTRQKLWLKLSHYGSLPFHVAEKLNRHVTAIAAYRLALAKGMSHEGGVREARTAVEKTQFEYARWARPKFMRGKLGGTVFVFQNYMQNALYFALGGDPGALRMMVMLFMLSGIMGIPFAENIADLVDAAMTALKRRAGMKEPLTQIRTDLRELLNTMDVDPDLILHGMSSSTFGLANIGEFMGWPIPDVDLSGSLSMGRIIPGTQLLEPGYPKTTESVVKGILEFGSGAIGSAGIGILSKALNDHPDTWKAWEKAMPAAMRQVSKAARMYARGGEETRSGVPIAGFDMHDTKDQGELILQGLGFTPRELSKGWEGFIAQQQAVIYYKTWSSGLLRSWNFARETNDREAEKEANAEIAEYNKIVPFPEMRIGYDTRRQSFETYKTTRKFNALKIEQSTPYRRLSSSIQAVFEEGDSEDNK